MDRLIGCVVFESFDNVSFPRSSCLLYSVQVYITFERVEVKCVYFILIQKVVKIIFINSDGFTIIMYQVFEINKSSF